MPKIENEGRFNVRITEAKLKQMPKSEDPTQFAITLTGETDDGFHAFNTLYFNHKTISGGKQIGKSNFQAKMEDLQSIGVPNGDPRQIQGAIEQGLYAQFTMQNEEYNGEIRLKVKYMNPKSDEKDVSEVDWDSVLAEFDAPPAMVAPVVSTPPVVTPPVVTPPAQFAPPASLEAELNVVPPPSSDLPF